VLGYLFTAPKCDYKEYDYEELTLEEETREPQKAPRQATVF
jgi:hypothetical protein